MASSFIFLMAVGMILSGVAFGQSPPSTSACSGQLVSLSPCLSYITASSPQPSQQCCSALGSIVKNNPICLCQFLSGGTNVGVKINQTLAIELPTACKIATPPLSKCKDDGFPVPAVGSSPPTPPSGNAPGSNQNTNSPDSTSSVNGALPRYSIIGFYGIISMVSAIFFLNN